MTTRGRWLLCAGLALAIGALGLAELLAARRAAHAAHHPSAAPAASRGDTARPTAEVSLARSERSEVVPGPAVFTMRALRGFESGEAFDPDALYGRVTDARLEPVRGARLRIWAEDGKGPELASTLSDRSGRFRLRGLDPHRAYQLLCQAKGFLPNHEWRVSTGSELWIELEDGPAFAGVVLDAQTRAPLGGIELAIAFPDGSEDGIAPEAVVKSAADGSFAFPTGKLEGRFGVLARGKSLVGSWHGLTMRPQLRDGYELLLPAPREIALQVHEVDSEEPVAEAALEVRFDGQSIELRTDAIGRADFQVRTSNAEPMRLAVGLEGFCTTELDVELDPEAPTEVSVPLARGLEVTGRVLDAAGAPVAGAHVTCLVSQPEGRLPGVEKASSRSPQAWSDAQGRFALAGLMPNDGNPAVRARDESLGWSQPHRLQLHEPGHESVELVLRPGASIEGRLTAGGRPLGGTVHWQGSSAWGRVSVNDAGEYRIPSVPAGEVTLWAEGPEGFFKRFLSGPPPSLLVVEAGRTHRQDFELGAVAETIAGRVVDASGVGVANIEVSVFAGSEEHGCALMEVRTDRQGRFVLQSLLSGLTYEITAAQHELRSVTQKDVVAGGPPVELVLHPVGKVRLRVTDARNGTVPPKCALQWRSHGQPAYLKPRWLRPGPDGLFELEFRAGLIDLQVSTDELGRAPASVEGVLVDPNAPAPLVELSLE